MKVMLKFYVMLGDYLLLGSKNNWIEIDVVDNVMVDVFVQFFLLLFKLIYLVLVNGVFVLLEEWVIICLKDGDVLVIWLLIVGG